MLLVGNEPMTRPKHAKVTFSGVYPTTQQQSKANTALNNSGNTCSVSDARRALYLTYLSIFKAIFGFESLTQVFRRLFQF